MATYTVKKIVSSEDAQWQGLYKTYFITSGKTVYILTKPQNVPAQGDVLEGSISQDKAMNYKFTKDKVEQGAQSPQTASTPSAALSAIAKQYKADPDKMQQDFTLEKAKNMSIQRQVAVKGAVELIVAGKAELTDLHVTYTDLMRLLTEPNWETFVANYTEDDDLPPVEVYDNLPTDDDVAGVEQALDQIEIDEPF